MGLTQEHKKQIFTDNQRQDIEIKKIKEDTAKITELFLLKDIVKAIMVWAIMVPAFIVGLVLVSYDIIADLLLKQHSDNFGGMQISGLTVCLIYLLFGAVMLAKINRGRK